MVEFEKDDREMAVDVPDSFVAHTKTPPKYPPPARMNGGGGGSGRSLNHNDVDTPPPPSRDHLRIERDGNLLNTREGPTPPSRDHHHQGSGFVVPTEQQSQRMKKYSDELVKRAREAERRDKSEDFLRLSIRNSQRLNALKENSSNNISGLANGAFVGDAVEAMTKLPDPNEVLKSVKRLQQSGVLSGDISASIRTLVTSSEFQGALTLNQKVLSSALLSRPPAFWQVENSLIIHSDADLHKIAVQLSKRCSYVPVRSSSFVYHSLVVSTLFKQSRYTDLHAVTTLSIVYKTFVTA